MIQNISGAIDKFFNIPAIPEQHAAQIHGEQIAAFKTLLPFGLAATAINAAAIIIFNVLSGWTSGTMIWAGVSVTMIVVSAPEVIRVRRPKNLVHPRSAKDLGRPIFSALPMG